MQKQSLPKTPYFMQCDSELLLQDVSYWAKFI